MSDTPKLQEAAEGGCQHAIVHPLRVLVACEYSGAVRDAFRAAAHKENAAQAIASSGV